MGEEGDGVLWMSDEEAATADAERVLRITAIKNRSSLIKKR